MSKNIKAVPTQDFEDVIATATKYVEGLRIGSSEGVAEAFHKHPCPRPVAAAGLQRLPHAYQARWWLEGDCQGLSPVRGVSVRSIPVCSVALADRDLPSSNAHRKKAIMGIAAMKAG